MKERRQSFFERLTGAQVVADDDNANNVSVDKNPPTKPWSPKVDGYTSTVEASEYEDVEPDTDDEEGNEEAGLAVDMYESDNELIIQSMIAGVTPENLHIAITKNSVTIKGNRVAPQGISDDQYLERELYWGAFSSEITLPYEIDTDGAEAVEKYGLLIIRLPKFDVNRAQELKVRSI